MSDIIDDNLQSEIAASLQIELSGKLSEQEFIAWLSQKINDMIVQDFERFLSLLYIIDIDEKKVKEALKDSKDEYAGKIIAEMIIKRQQQKKYWRAYFKNIHDDTTPESEKW